MLTQRDVAVIGGGVAGLAAAVALARRGAAVEVFERSAALGEAGGGLQVAPNGMRVLDALGLGGAARAASLRAEAVVLVDGLSGRTVTRLDLLRHAPELEWRLFHRADLVALLATEAGAAGVALRMGQAVDAGPDRPGGVDLGAGGRRALAIGADGIRSAARAALNGRAVPLFSGQVAWRAQVPWEGPPTREVRVYLGPGAHLVTYPLRDGRMRNLVAVEERVDWSAETWVQRDDPANLRDAFAGWCDAVAALVAPLDDVYLWGLFRHPVAARWHGPHLALAGDAAHPTLPFLAQGANLALEDAWVLAAMLDRFPQSEALARYQAAREARVRRALAAADANGRNYHLRGVARWAAHRALWLAGYLAPAAPLRRLDWLYRHDVTRDRASP